MKPEKSSLNIKTIESGVGIATRRAGRFAVVFFVLFLAAIYGFIVLQISTLSNVQPSDAAVTSQLKVSSTPHVDPNVVQQMQALQDNSVSVQSLFNQARSNPFQE